MLRREIIYVRFIDKGLCHSSVDKGLCHSYVGKGLCYSYVDKGLCYSSVGAVVLGLYIHW